MDYFGGDWHDVYCRGEIIERELSEDHLDITTETAWQELNEVRSFLKETFQDIDIYYISEEPGIGAYYTNDVNGDIFYTHYWLDSCDSDIEPDYFNDMYDVITYLNSYNIDGLEKFNEDASEEYVKKTLKSKKMTE